VAKSNRRRQARLDGAEFERRVSDLLANFATRVADSVPESVAANARPPADGPEIAVTSAQAPAGDQHPQPTRTRRRKRTLNEWIAIAVLDALEQNQWNKSAAATQLGIHRSRIRRMIAQFRLAPRTTRRSR
jgi:DNA-binding NtrC family response regulator